MLVDADDLREVVQSEIEGVLAMGKDVNASEVYLTRNAWSVNKHVVAVEQIGLSMSYQMWTQTFLQEV